MSLSFSSSNSDSDLRAATRIVGTARVATPRKEEETRNVTWTTEDGVEAIAVATRIALQRHVAGKI
jgi:hypothetical protein